MAVLHVFFTAISLIVEALFSQYRTLHQAYCTCIWSTVPSYILSIHKSHRILLSTPHFHSANTFSIALQDILEGFVAMMRSIPQFSSILLVLMIVFFWLSSECDQDGTTRADRLIAVLARKLAVNSDLDASLLIEGLQVVITSQAFCNSSRSSLNYRTLSIAMLCAVLTFFGLIKNNLPSLEKIQLPKFRITDLPPFRSWSEYDSERQGLLDGIDKLKEDIIRLKQSDTMKGEMVADLIKQNAKLTLLQNQPQVPIAQLSPGPRKNNKGKASVVNVTPRKSTASSNAIVASPTPALKGSLQQRYQELLEEKNELQFDNELLKCLPPIDSTPNPSVMSNFASPFILVLVDGDAYNWSYLQFNQTKHNPGASAAYAIKSEVQQYMLANKERIPLHSRIVVRVYQNIKRDQSTGPLTPRQLKVIQFAKDFSESSPLFDYVDSGSGKERADSKIHEWTHLFTANPYCRTIFLAASTDNGFARMLEPYVGDVEAKEKIVLVHPGYVIREIAELGFKSVKWQSVFQDRYPPPGARKFVPRQTKDRKTSQPAGVAMLLLRGCVGSVSDYDLSVRVGVSGAFRGIKEVIDVESEDARIVVGAEEELD